MEKNIDHWNEIADLINKDKERALADFHYQEFYPAPIPEIRLSEHPLRRLAGHPVLLAVAASLFLAIGLLSFWRLRGSWQKAPTALQVENLLAGSFLYGRSSETEEKAPDPRTVSAFSSALSAWGTAVGADRAAAPVAKPVDPSIQVEHGDPAAVQRKIEKTIRENTIERVLTQFCQICKEV